VNAEEIGPSRIWSHVERGHDRLIAKRLVVLQPVEHHFRLAREVGRPDAGERKQRVVVFVRIKGVESLIRAVVLGAWERFSMPQRVSRVRVAVGSERPIDSGDQLLSVLRVTAAGIERN